MRAERENIDLSQEASFAFYDRKAPGWDFYWHYHPEYELTLIGRGSGQRLVGDHIGEFGDGDLVLLGPNLPHAWVSRQPSRKRSCQAIVVQFLQGFLGDGFFARPEVRPIGRLLAQAGRGLRFTGPRAAAAADRMRGMAEMRPLERLGQLLEVLDLLARCSDVQVLTSARYRLPQRQRTQRRTDRVLQFIHAHYAQDISLADAAAAAQLGESAFGRFFQRAVGKTFRRYVNELRVGRACELLAQTDRPIVAVAMECGFNNLSNFNRRFLELRQIRPRDYRRGLQEIATTDARG